MPFLVDSIRMELTRHEVTTHLVVHPQLRVRRDVTGALREVIGLVDGERPGPRRDRRVVDPHRDRAGCPTARVPSCSGTWSGCSATCGWRWRTGTGCRPGRCSWPSSWRWSGGTRRRSRRISRRGRGAAALAGRRALHVPRLPRVRPGWTGRTGWRCAPCPAPGSASCGTTGQASKSFAALPPEVRARAKDPQLLILTKANSRSTVHRPSYLDYVAVKRLDSSGQVAGEYRFLGLYTHDAYTESITRIPVLRRKLTEVLAATGHRRRQPRRQGPRRVHGELPARGAVPDPGAAARPGRRGRAPAARAHPDPAVPAQGRLRPVHVLPDLPAPGPLHHPGQAAHPGDPAPGARHGAAWTTA